MSRIATALRSSIGAKSIMAATGLALVGFVIAHMLGNLQIFAGPETLNAYAAQLQSLGPLLWVARSGLLAVFVVHLMSAMRLVQANKAARPEGYVYAQRYATSTFASRTMWMTGLITLAFVIYHLLHFTFGVVQSGNHGFEYTMADGSVVHDVYKMVVLGFQNPVVTLSYVVANVLLAIHISHGASSAFHTLGVTNPRLAFLRKGFGPGLAAVIALGNVAMPLAALLGILEVQA